MARSRILFCMWLAMLSLPALAQEVLTTSLPENSALASVVEEAATELLDGNISTGTTSLRGFRLVGAAPKTDLDFQKLVLSLFAEAFAGRTDEALPASAKVEFHRLPYGKAAKEQTVFALATGNAYDTSNPENFVELRQLTNKVLRALKANRGSKVGYAKVRLHDDSSGELRDVFFFLYLNPKTKDAVSFFIIEGTM